MHWSALLVLTAGLSAPQSGAPLESYASYTKAYYAAQSAERPMLVVINPPTGEAAAALTVEQLQANPEVAPLLDKYVIAVVDASTDHGQKVHEIFGSRPLPYVSIVDEHQEHQLYKVSGEVAPAALQTALERYQDGAPVMAVVAPKPYCARCQQQQYYGF